MADTSIAQARVCTKCGEEKPLSSFTIRKDRGTPYAACRACRTKQQGINRRANPEAARLRVAKHREANREAINAAARDKYAADPNRGRAKTKAWREAHPERSRASVKVWRDANSEHRADYFRQYRAREVELFRGYDRKRRASPQGKLENALKCRVWKTLKDGKGGARTFALLGYSAAELMNHLERQFKRGMTWANYGEWHVDHIVPLSSFNYATADCPEFRAAWALTNLRPMWAGENIAKGAKRLTLL